MCSDSQKVWMTFKCKRIPIQKVVVDMEETPVWVTEADGSTGKLPILEITDAAVVCDTKIMLEFATDLPVKG